MAAEMKEGKGKAIDSVEREEDASSLYEHNMPFYSAKSDAIQKGSEGTLENAQI